MFRKADVVNYHICGLKLSVRELMVQHVRLIPSADLVKLDAVNQAAVGIGNSESALTIWKKLKKV